MTNAASLFDRLDRSCLGALCYEDWKGLEAVAPNKQIKVHLTRNDFDIFTVGRKYLAADTGRINREVIKSPCINSFLEVHDSDTVLAPELRVLRAAGAQQLRASPDYQRHAGASGSRHGFGCSDVSLAKDNYDEPSHGANQGTRSSHRTWEGSR